LRPDGACRYAACGTACRDAMTALPRCFFNADFTNMTETRIYIHEYVAITGQNRANYFRHVTESWSAKVREEKQQICAGVWGTVGSTGRWPEVVNLWEHGSWEAVTHNFAFELNHPDMQDPSLRAWWSDALNYRSGGYDRLLVNAPYSPSIYELVKDEQVVGSKVYLHEIIRVVPGQAMTYLELLERHWVPLAKGMGQTLAGAYRTLMRDDAEVILIWAMRDWPAWMQFEIARERSAQVDAWRARTRAIAVDLQGHLMCPAPLSPLATGRIL